MKYTRLSQGLFFLRVTCSSLFFTHGYSKVLKIINGDFTFSDPIGLGPFTSLILTAFAEFIVPIFIIIGWKTRFFCIFPIITMFLLLYSNTMETHFREKKNRFYTYYYLFL